MSPLLFPPLFAVGMVVLTVAFAWWIWSLHTVVIFAFYYNKGLEDSTATIRIRRLNRKWEQRSVFGNCTVWHSAKTGERQPTYIERALANRWALEHHQRQKGS